MPGRRAQLAVYHGQQTLGSLCGDPGRAVYFYPTEYLSYGDAESATLMTDPRNGQKEYRIHDHLRSVRATVKPGGITAIDSLDGEVQAWH